MLEAAVLRIKHDDCLNARQIGCHGRALCGQQGAVNRDGRGPFPRQRQRWQVISPLVGGGLGQQNIGPGARVLSLAQSPVGEMRNSITSGMRSRCWESWLASLGLRLRITIRYSNVLPSPINRV